MVLVASVCLAAGLLAGFVLGCLGTRWYLQATRCPRCDELAALLDIRYVCGTCGERIEEEEI